MSAPLVDGFGRRIRTLRLSLTDRCNFRCVYCLPPEGVDALDRQRYLSRRALVRLVATCARMGVRSVRLTGGEPLLRRDIVELVRALHRSGGAIELSLTTNASRLAVLAGPLRRAGLARVNVSLDSLDPERFVRVTRYRRYERVREGIDAALAAGLHVKLNVVVLRDMEDGEILDFVRLAVERQLDVRFLEFMPLCGSGWRPDLVYPLGEVRALIEQTFRLVPLARGDAPAEPFAVDDGAGRVGFIAPLTDPFCDTCSRIRVSVDGKLRPCLFSHAQFDLRAALEHGDDHELEVAIRAGVAAKPRGSQYDHAPFHPAGCTDTEQRRARATSAPRIHNIGG